MKRLLAIKLIFILFPMLVFTMACNGQNSNKKINDLRTSEKLNKYGIEGRQAPELIVPLWIDADGNKSDPISLAEFDGKFKVMYCFQAWCPGCHSRGLPALQKMVTALEDNDQVEFLAIQTVFEGARSNTFERVKEIQKEYDLKIPFGHDVGNEDTRNISSTMFNYRTGGTPWFIFIDQNNKVIFNDYHLNTEKAIAYLKEIK